eukprot:11661472-Ditylum_brightwellii.AAC.1
MLNRPNVHTHNVLEEDMQECDIVFETRKKPPAQETHPRQIQIEEEIRRSQNGKEGPNKKGSKHKILNRQKMCTCNVPEEVRQEFEIMLHKEEHAEMASK